MNVIEEIRERLRMEIRPNSQGFEYLEAVVRKSDLELLRSLLREHLGPAVKEAGTEANLPIEIEGLVDSMGGLRIGQSFLLQEGG